MESAFLTGYWFVRKLCQPIGKRRLLVRKLGQPIGKHFHCQQLVGQKMELSNRKALSLLAIGWSEICINQKKAFFYQRLVSQILPTKKKVSSLLSFGWSENITNQQESAFLTGYWLVRKLGQPIGKHFPYQLSVGQKILPTNWKVNSLPADGWSENCANQQESTFIAGCWLVRKLGQPIGKHFPYQLLVGQKMEPTNRKVLSILAIGWSEICANQKKEAIALLAIGQSNSANQ